ncbi:MAG: chromate efflux transporter [Polyangiaceae bacterium]
MTTEAEPEVVEPRTSLVELALLFSRLGATAFGGPAAHIAMMNVEVVKKRHWMTEQRFLDLLGAANLIPGPNSTELAIHIGWERRRWAGLLVAGVSFIVPAALLAGGLGWAYVRYGALPAVGWILYGVKPAMVGVIVQALVGLAPKAAKTLPLRAVGLVALVATALGVHELGVLFGAGCLSILAARPWREPPGSPPLVALAPGMLGVLTVPAGLTLPAIFVVFAKIGSVLFGSGYVLLAFLRSDLVQRLGWITEGQLMDAVTVGQITPGPVFTTATFIGYVLRGPSGAAVATLGIFLPAFVFVAMSGPLVQRIRGSRWAGTFLDGVNVASLALMAFVTFQLGRASLVDVPTILIGLASAAVLLRWKPNPTWLVLGGGALGALLQGLGLVGWAAPW